MRHLEEMAVFAKVGELGSISGAARALSLPKSSVSRAVARLEAAYKARLVERTTRKVTLTEIGEALHAHCRAMVAEAENAEAEIAAYQGHPSGLLRVAAPTTIGRNILGPHIAEFLGLYPELELRLTLTDRIMNPARDAIDVVLHSGWLEDSSLVARKITDIGAILVATPAYLDAHGTPRTVADLANYNVIGFPFEGAPPVTLVRGSERFEVATWKRFACNDPIINLDLVGRGLAIAPLSSYFAAGRLGKGELVQVLPDYRLHDPPALWALYTGRTALSPKIAVLLDFLADLAVRVRQDPSLIRA